MKVIFLGTSSMQPTKDRGLSSIWLDFGKDKVLVDCGEGTQRQLKIAGLKPTKLSKIFLTHCHGDHMLGLGGLIYYLSSNEYKGTLQVYGPKGLKEYYKHLLQSCMFSETIEIKIHEIENGIIYEDDEYYVEALKLEHQALCYGYNFIEKDKRKINLDYIKKHDLEQHPILGKLQKGEDIEWNGKIIKASKGTTLVKGKKLSIVIDTGLCSNALKLAKDADLLISESTFLDNLKEQAKERKHLTAKQAAEIAKKSKVKKLALTHFSQRYKSVDEVEKEAKKIFKNTVLAEDFMEINV